MKTFARLLHVLIGLYLGLILSSCQPGERPKGSSSNEKNIYDTVAGQHAPELKDPVQAPDSLEHPD